MGRPDIQGTVIDDVGGGAEGGKNNGPEIENDAENLDTLDEQGDNANAERGGENQEDGENVGGEEGALQNEDGESKPVKSAGFPAELREQLRQELREEMRAEMRAEMQKQNPPAPAKEISEEEWAKHEADWGIPRTAIKATVSRMERVAQHVLKAMDERFAKFEKAESLRTLSREKGFEDSMRYQKDIDEFLTQYQPQFHSNPTVLKRAVIYARGLHAKDAVTKARNGNERNLRIVQPGGRPGAGGAPVRTGSKVQLTASQKSAARSVGWTDQQYIENKFGKRKQLT